MQPKDWDPPPRPGEMTESRLIQAIVDGTFSINSTLPGERRLAEMLGVTRPTLREAMQRMARDGWLEIHHGKATRVRDFWKEGGLGVSIALVRHQLALPSDYAANLLAVRVLLAPTYTRQAVENKPDEIITLLKGTDKLGEDADAFAAFDWQLHWLLTIHSGNPFFTHFINSVQGLYELLGVRYFESKDTRAHSMNFYQELLSAAEAGDGLGAELLTKRVMRESREFWMEIGQNN